jgi:cytochrome c oxidase assembly protein subunit 15
MLAIVMALASFKILSSGYLRKVLGTQIFAAMILLGIQVTLGGLTVLKLLEAKTVAAHLLNALLFYAVLLWMTFRVKRLALDPSALKSYKIPGTTKGLFLAVTLALFAQIALGGMVSSNFAGMVCPDFPQCHGEWLPPSLFPFVIQMLHRAAGVVVLAFAMVLWVATYRLKLPPLAHYAVRLTPWMLIIQIGLGVFNVLYALPIAASAAHLANAVAIYTLMILGTLSVFTDGEHQGQMPTQDTLSETPSLLVEGVT